MSEARYLVGIKTALNGADPGEVTRFLEKVGARNGLVWISIEIDSEFIFLEFYAPLSLSPLDLVRMLKGALGLFLARRNGTKIGPLRSLPFFIVTVGSPKREELLEALRSERCSPRSLT